MSIQKEIRTGLGGLRLGARPHNGKNLPSFLSPDDITKILKYLDGKGVAVRVCENGETAWTKIPYEYCKWERLIDED